jgi:ParB/RepB/Spo0J family partition protein
MEIQNIAINAIRDSQLKVRNEEDPAGLTELAASIAKVGLLQPIVVEKSNDGGYTMIAGRRRLHACMLAGWTEIPANVYLEGNDADLMQIVENLQRENVSPLEQYEAFMQIIEKHPGSTLHELALQCGKTSKWASEILALGKLSEETKTILRDKLISYDTALLLSALSHKQQKEVIKDHEFERGDGKKAYSNHEEFLRSLSGLSGKARKNLDSAPFDIADKTLSARGSCFECVYNTDNSNLMFSEENFVTFCFLPGCYDKKENEHVKREVKKAGLDYNKIPKLINQYWTDDDDRKRGIISRSSWIEVPEDKPCSYMEPAVWLQGMNAGKIVQICCNPKCKIHWAVSKNEITSQSKDLEPEVEPKSFIVKRKIERRQYYRNRKINLKTRRKAALLIANSDAPLTQAELDIIAFNLHYSCNSGQMAGNKIIAKQELSPEEPISGHDYVWPSKEFKELAPAEKLKTIRTILGAELVFEAQNHDVVATKDDVLQEIAMSHNIDLQLLYEETKKDWEDDFEKDRQQLEGTIEIEKQKIAMAKELFDRILRHDLSDETAKEKYGITSLKSLYFGPDDEVKDYIESSGWLNDPELTEAIKKQYRKIHRMCAVKTKLTKDMDLIETAQTVSQEIKDILVVLQFDNAYKTLHPISKNDFVGVGTTWDYLLYFLGIPREENMEKDVIYELLMAKFRHLKKQYSKLGIDKYEVCPKFTELFQTNDPSFWMQYFV